MFPPPAAKKKTDGPPPPGAGGGGGGMPPDPFGGGGMPPGMPPMMPPPGMPKPGQGMDPMMAMMQGLGPDPMGGGMPQAQQGPPTGPGGMPVGGSMPSMDPNCPDGDCGDMGGSDLLKALSGSLGGGGMQGDPYGVSPMQPGQGFQGIGTGDPSMGLEQMLQLLALGGQGVGGGPGAGSSGLDTGPFGNMGQMVGY